MVYWHRELPPVNAEALGEHTLEAISGRVPDTIAHREELWSQCKDDLMARVHDRLLDEVSRLGGHYAHVLRRRYFSRRKTISLVRDPTRSIVESLERSKKRKGAEHIMRTGRRSKTGGYRTILCAVDFSLQSYAALQTAIQIAKKNDGRVTALYVEDPLIGAGAAASGYDTALLKKSTLAQLGRLMEQMATPAGLNREAWHVEARLGKPARTIVAFAQKLSADLIVMGTNGRTGPAKLFFGSVADAVLRRAPVPVLVVARSRPKREPQDILSGRVVGAIDLGKDDRLDARRMAQAAEMIGGPLTLVHVVYRADGVPALSASLGLYYERELAAARNRLQRIATGVGAKHLVVLGRPEDEIAASALNAKAGIIVLVLRRGRGVFGPRQGATTYRILCSSSIPVLALPPM